jgi:hypothetical protein
MLWFYCEESISFGWVMICSEVKGFFFSLPGICSEKSCLQTFYVHPIILVFPCILLSFVVRFAGWTLILPSVCLSVSKGNWLQETPRVPKPMDTQVLCIKQSLSAWPWEGGLKREVPFSRQARPPHCGVPRQRDMSGGRGRSFKSTQKDEHHEGRSDSKLRGRWLLSILPKPQDQFTVGARASWEFEGQERMWLAMCAPKTTLRAARRLSHGHDRLCCSYQKAKSPGLSLSTRESQSNSPRESHGLHLADSRHSVSFPWGHLQ